MADTEQVAAVARALSRETVTSWKQIRALRAALQQTMSALEVCDTRVRVIQYRKEEALRAARAALEQTQPE